MKKCDFSIIIPVINEVDIINNSIEHLYNLQSKRKFEVIVIDGDRNKRTIDTIQNKKVQKYVSPIGRGNQLNKGVKHARGEIVIDIKSKKMIIKDLEKLQEISKM